MRINEPASDAALATRESSAEPVAQQVAVQLRRQILEGRFEPGTKLPTWSSLEADFQVARTTLAKAVRQLKRDGFVYSQSTRGTFVTDHPPHLYRFALAFRHEPESPAWLRFWWSLANEATARNRAAEHRLIPFFGVCGSDDTESHRALIADIEADRLAGVIFVGYPPEISRPLMHHPWLAKVAILADPLDEQMPRVFPDRASFIDRSLACLAERGARRIAVVTSGHPDFSRFDDAIPNAGLQTLPHHRVAATLHDPASANHIVQLLLRQPADERPDALIITDDNLVGAAIAGVAAAGANRPDNLQILAHCNWPTEAAQPPGVIRLGFDARAVLDAAMQKIIDVRNARDVAELTPVPARFEHEAARAPSAPPALTSY
ncbi:MAG: GntR family transcriptional regulator [Planctomycetota bacterium]